LAKKYETEFPKREMCAIDKEFGGWAKAQNEDFSIGGTFDQISQL